MLRGTLFVTLTASLQEIQTQIENSVFYSDYIPYPIVLFIKFTFCVLILCAKTPLLLAEWPQQSAE